MGTDIHIAVEARRNGAWENMTPFKNEDGYLSNYGHPYDLGRNYDVFAILANVRNGTGFAGVKTGDGFNFITDERGIPDDATADVREWAEGGDHSHTFMTVAEIMAFDWTQKTNKAGVIGGLKQLAEWKLSGRPDSWSGGVSGPGIKVFEATDDVVKRFDSVIDAVAEAHGKHKSAILREMLWNGGEEFGPKADAPAEFKAVQIALADEFGCERPHFRVSWGVSYYEPARELLGEVLPKLWRLGAPEDVRLIMWFDS